MHQPRIDRRSARTRSSLRGALESLVETRAYDEISVAEICDTANVGRSTFYGHFAGKDALKRDALEGLRRDLLSARADALASDADVLLALARALFMHARAHGAHYRALGGADSRSHVIGFIEGVISDIVENDLPRDMPLLQRTCVSRLIAGAYMAALIWWLDSEMPIPPLAIAALCRQAITHTAAPLPR